MRKQPALPRPGVFLFGILIVFALAVVLVFLFMRPQLKELMDLALILALTGLGWAATGYLSHRLGWWRRFGSLRSALLASYLLAAGLTLASVWLTARLMFISEHDLTLAGLLLLFAGGVSVSFAYFLSSSVTHALRELAQGAERLSEGDFSVRVPIDGRDEAAQLAQAFNAMAARLMEANEEARRLEAARRDFIAWASHDLRTPLASLRAIVDALADGVVDDPETVARYLEQCKAEIFSMSALIDNLFELAKLDTGRLALEFEPSSLSDLISDSLQSVAARARAKGVEVSGRVDPGVDPVRMASGAIGRVLQNLLENAIHHTPSGGKIRVQAELHDGDVDVAVTDTGEGIPPEDLGRVFENFYRGEQSRSRKGYASGGAGLGLAIAKGMVEAHGGRIWAESEPGRGTKVAFSLPKGTTGQ